jgi:hypothetical protein
VRITEVMGRLREHPRQHTGTQVKVCGLGGTLSSFEEPERHVLDLDQVRQKLGEGFTRIFGSQSGDFVVDLVKGLGTYVAALDQGSEPECFTRSHLYQPSGITAGKRLRVDFGSRLDGRCRFRCDRRECPNGTSLE